jgi:3-hydroxybutyryl-CoA dehydrogenase
MNAPNQNTIVGIVGAGAMGRGIAQVTVTGGMTALIYDAAEGAAAQALDFVVAMIDRAVEKNRLQAEAANDAKARLKIVDSLAELAPCDLVIEAIVENLEIKQQVFQALEAVLAEAAIIVSNTSSIRIASIASACTRRPRIAGMHFFNPVPLMRLVEIIRAPETSDATAEALAEFGRRMGRTPVAAKDGPGFLVNLGGRAYTTEGLRIAHENVASPAQIDAVMRECCGYRMGPFELMDLTGIDVNFPVSKIVFEGHFQDQRLATSPLHEALFAAGRYGRKTKAGFYDYDDDGAPSGGGAAADHVSGAVPAARVVLAEDDPDLADLMAQAGAEVLAADDGHSPMVCAPIGEDCTAVAVRGGFDHRRLVAIDTLTLSDKRITIMTAPGTEAGVRDAVAALLNTQGLAVTAISDSPGFIAPRICAMVANLGCEMAQTGVATPDDIDTAMTLGLNYPQGPLALTGLAPISPDILTGLRLGFYEVSR